MKLEVSYQCLELLASVFHVFKEVETSATGTQQHGITRLGHAGAGRYAFFHAVSVGHGQAQMVEVLVKFGVVPYGKRTCIVVTEEVTTEISEDITYRPLTRKIDTI